jgi:tetratricopeptide (TPR) repeat protein
MSKPLVALGLVVLAFAAYANSLQNGFVWDDPIILTRQLPVFRTVGSVFFPPPYIPQFAPDYYRPLVVGSYLVDNGVGGGQPSTFHLTLVVAHVLATLAVFGLGLALFGAPQTSPSSATTAAAIGAALFAVHPIHTEAVAWIAGRADVFAGLFATLSVFAFLRSRTQPRLVYVAGACLFVALLAKEVAISVAVLVLALDWLLPEAAAPASITRTQKRRGEVSPPTRSAWLRYLPLAAAIGLYALLRVSAITGGVTTNTGQGTNPLSPIRMLGVIGAYFGKLVLPISLNAYIYDAPPSAAAVAAGVAAIALFGAGLWYCLRRGWREAAFLLVWIGVTLAPALTILFKIPEVPMAERYLYLPSVGFCLLVGLAAERGLAAKGGLRLASAAATALVLVACLAATVARNRVWSSDLLLWTDTSAKNPSAGMPFSSLGGALLRANRIGEAEAAYQEALRRSSPPIVKVTILSNLGMIAISGGDLERAEEYYRGAVAVRPTSDAQYNLGVTQLRRAEALQASGNEQLRREKAAAALANLEAAARANAYEADIPVAIGQALTMLGRQSEARPYYERALALGLQGEVATRVRAELARP